MMMSDEYLLPSLRNSFSYGTSLSATVMRQSVSKVRCLCCQLSKATRMDTARNSMLAEALEIQLY